MLDKELLRQRLAFIRQGSEVERFHTKRMIQRNDIGHHSYHVAWLAYLMASAVGMTNEGRLRIVLAALAHDLAEHITGDMPGDFKREMGIREQFSSYENSRFAEIGFDFENELDTGHPIDEKRILKLADMMDGAFFCISEASFGNARVGIVFANFRKYIEAFAPFNECEAAIVEYIDELWAHYGVNDAPGWSKTAHAARSGTAFAVDEPADPSKAANLGDMPVAEGRQNDAMDDRASQDLAAPPSMPANARQHGGDHYKGVGYEHWDFVLDTGMNYFQGCATKYVTRCYRHESGAELNLLKAIHYVDKIDEAEQAGRIKPMALSSHTTALADFAAANQLNEEQRFIIQMIIAWNWDGARRGLQRLLHGLDQSDSAEESDAQ